MYGNRWNNLERTPPRVVWQMLRALRHLPPGRARSVNGRQTFDAALERSEQHQTAASAVLARLAAHQRLLLGVLTSGSLRRSR